jgi:pSer/pThr/pTyr-binding forkhead associated (FHA) protein
MAASWSQEPATAVEAHTVAQATWLLVPVGEGAAPDGSGAIRLTGTEVVLGRSRSADVTVDDGTVSSRHLRFEALPDGRWGVADLGSTNGTRLNGAPLTAPAVLGEGDEVRIGALTWRAERR